MDLDTETENTKHGQPSRQSEFMLDVGEGKLIVQTLKACDLHCKSQWVHSTMSEASWRNERTRRMRGYVNSMIIGY